MGDTKIEWADAVWNPVTGCTKVSAGCKNCYAERDFHRPYPGRDFTDVRCHPERLEHPLHWRKPRRIFVNSMSDLFHEAVHRDFILRVFGVMERCPQHTFQILTKRAERMRRFLSEWLPSAMTLAFPGEHTFPLSNVWLGVSVENQKTADQRIPLLLQTPAAVRFVSYEPALGPIDFREIVYRDEDNEILCRPLAGYFEVLHSSSMDIISSRELGDDVPRLDWVICGGESGPHARPMHPGWARSARDQCQAAGVPFFFKQWGEWGNGETIYGPTRRYRTQTYFNERWSDCSDDWVTEEDEGPIMYRIGKRAAGRLLDGREWNEFPESHK